MNTISQLKNIMQIRQVLVTRALLMTFQETIADDLVLDTTYNIMNPIVDTGVLLTNPNWNCSENMKILVNEMDSFLFWIMMGFLLSSIYYTNQNYVYNGSKTTDKINLIKDIELVLKNEDIVGTVASGTATVASGTATVASGTATVATVASGTATVATVASGTATVANKNKMARLQKFIPYNTIRTSTSFIISLFVFIFTKNVLPAT